MCSGAREPARGDGHVVMEQVLEGGGRIGVNFADVGRNLITIATSDIEYNSPETCDLIKTRLVRYNVQPTRLSVFESAFAWKAAGIARLS